MDVPPVSIVVPAFNAERFIGEALDSLLGQTFSEVEIIVCDDASTDRTGEVVRSLRDSRIRYLRNERTLGGYGAVNRGAQEARGRFLAVYHADDVYGPTIVEREVAYLESHPTTGAVFCLDRFIDGAGREYDRLQLPDDLSSVDSFDARTLTEALLRHKNTFLRTPSVMFRRSIFEEMGGFDQEGYGIAADLELWLRMALHHPIGLIPEHLYSYRSHAEQWSRVYERLRTAPEPFFRIMDEHLSRLGVRELVSPAALTLYRLWRAKDEAERAANWLVLGDRRRAVALLDGTLARPLLRSERPGLAARLLVLRSLVRAAAAAGGGRLARTIVYAARFRRLPPRRIEPPEPDAAHTLARDRGEAPAGSRPWSSRKPVALAFIDPFSPNFCGDGLFDPDSRLNRDNCLRPWFRLRARLADLGVEAHTADYLEDLGSEGTPKVYASFGIRDRYERLAKRDDVLLTAFYLFETVVVEPDMYRAIPDLVQHFRRVYSWSDAQSLSPFVGEVPPLHSFRIPMPYETVLEPHWSRQERAGVVMVSGNKRAVLPRGELYTERLRALRHFAGSGAIDLWGIGWERGLGDGEAEFGEAVRRVYRGPAADKYETLSRYRFAIAYENMVLRGWITEKIFDCFYAGVVPIYLGAPDIADFVPPDCFIDRREFATDADVKRFLDSLGPREIRKYREAGRDFVRSERFRPFTADAFAERFIADLDRHLAERGVPRPWG